MVVGCIPELQSRILLCRRAIEPCHGKWTLPAGYLENGETVSAGAARETFEEARAKVEILAPYALYNICYVNQLYLMFRARLTDDNFRAGSESLEVKLFSKDEIPWSQIAFQVIEETLAQYFKDRPSGRFSFYIGEIHKKKKTKRESYQSYCHRVQGNGIQWYRVRVLVKVGSLWRFA